MKFEELIKAEEYINKTFDRMDERIDTLDLSDATKKELKELTTTLAIELFGKFEEMEEKDRNIQARVSLERNILWNK